MSYNSAGRFGGTRRGIRCASWIALAAAAPFAAHAEGWSGALTLTTGAPASTLGWIVTLSAAEVLLHSLFVCGLVRSAGKPAALGTAYHVLMVSQCANALTPFRAGLPLRLYLYSRIFGIDYAAGTALLAVETVVIAVVPAAVAGGGVLLLFPASGLVGPSAVALGLAALLLIPWLYPHRLFERRGDRAWARWGRRVGTFLRRVGAALGRTPAWVVALGSGCVLASVLVQGGRLDTILSALGSSPGLSAATAAFAISFTLGSLSMLPLGIGVRDVTLAWLLSELGVGGAAVAIVVVAQRLFAPGMYVVLGVLSGWRLGLRHLLRRPPRADE